MNRRPSIKLTTRGNLVSSQLRVSVTKGESTRSLALLLLHRIAEKGWDRQEFIKKTQIDKSDLSNFFSGKKPLSKNALRKAAKALGIEDPSVLDPSPAVASALFLEAADCLLRSARGYGEHFKEGFAEKLSVGIEAAKLLRRGILDVPPEQGFAWESSRLYEIARSTIRTTCVLRFAEIVTDDQWNRMLRHEEEALKRGVDFRRIYISRGSGLSVRMRDLRSMEYKMRQNLREELVSGKPLPELTTKKRRMVIDQLVDFPKAVSEEKVRVKLTNPGIKKAVIDPTPDTFDIIILDDHTLGLSRFSQGGIGSYYHYSDKPLAESWCDLFDTL